MEDRTAMPERYYEPLPAPCGAPPWNIVASLVSHYQGCADVAWTNLDTYRDNLLRALLRRVLGVARLPLLCHCGRPLVAGDRATLELHRGRQRWEEVYVLVRCGCRRMYWRHVSGYPPPA